VKFRSIIFSLYIIIFPFYFYPPGSIQISDAIGIIFIFFSIVKILKKYKDLRWLRFIFLFIIYTFFVNFAWYLSLGDSILLKPSLNYLYNFLLLAAFIAHFNDKTFLQYTFWSILISFSIQLFAYGLTSREWGYRSVIFFNNPNQLSLWSLNSLVILNIISHRLKVNNILLTAFSIVGTLFIFLSVSQAALISIFIYWIYYLFTNKIKIIYKFLILIFLLIPLSNNQNISSIPILERISLRIQTDNTDDNTLSSRGLDRIYNHPEYIFFGAGEGVNNRFDSVYKGEIHSSPFNILFSYGFIGLFLVLLFVKKLISFNMTSFVLVLMLFVFSMGHMTLRIPLFWIALSTIYFFNKKNNLV